MAVRNPAHWAAAITSSASCLNIFREQDSGGTPSGQEQVKAFRQKSGFEYPDVIREALEEKPAEFVGDWSGSDSSVEFNLGGEELVTKIELVLRGKGASADDSLQRLKEQHGWLASCPYGSVEDWMENLSG